MTSIRCKCTPYSFLLLLSFLHMCQVIPASLSLTAIIVGPSRPFDANKSGGRMYPLEAKFQYSSDIRQ